MAITLQKSGDSHKIDLSKAGNSKQVTVHVNLNWNQQSNQNAGLFAKLLKANSAPDLDLGCMYETVNGTKGVIQPLGGNFGAKDSSPYIFLDKDDRTGAASDGENMFIYRPDTIKRVMFFALIYQGAPDFGSVGGRMLFKVSNGEEIYLELNNPDKNRPLCAAAMVSNLADQITILKEEKYFSGHKEVDDYYRFGFNWVAGSK
ncbi:tellurium resistance protein TerA [Scytonema hofmannii FACHB-248]|uniref:Tellurium resistance protein TerA n=1 Tax=Scytonema hofmannii FACHB-248 TaxID=1842502 RepID=A0ABR8GWG6_9CYAN|nr:MULTISPECIES: tellurium resistance protein TerA [Nostocales]MBD2607078.1 tellurium resistance protein TerA [Scytonema hofmannii FACHB-248]